MLDDSLSTPFDFSALQKRIAKPASQGDPLAREITRLIQQISPSTAVPNLTFILPFIFQYQGAPVALDDYPCMEPLYNVRRPSRTLLLCSRQVGKSLNEAMTTILESLWTPYLNTLFVSPFFESVRRISTDYFASLIAESPVSNLMTGRGCISQVLERSFPSGSRIRFTYAHRNADRARGVHAHSLKRDEVQLMHEEVLPVLTATMSSSKWGNYIFDAGTPLTNANNASIDFKERSSRSHWMIPCRSCRKENIAALEHDLLGMIGKRSPHISRDNPGIKCANSLCGYKLFPWDGRYVHLRPEKRDEFLGLHVSQPILPLHCCDPKKWSDLINELENPMTPEYMKYNEFLGVPWDDGVSLITEADIDRVAVLNRNYLTVALNRLANYNGQVAIGIDWGGGGINRESRTKLAITALNNLDGMTEVVFGMDLQLAMPEAVEVEHVWTLVRQVLSRYPHALIAHDDNTFGSAKMAMLLQKGLPATNVWNMSYVGETAKEIIKMRPQVAGFHKSVWSIDKARALKYMSMAIKGGKIKFFRREKALNAEALLLDFTHLVAEEKQAVATNRADVLLIHRMVGQSDDFAHACTFSAIALWHKYKAWPDIDVNSFQITTPQDLASYVKTLHATLDSETIEALIRSPDFSQGT